MLREIESEKEREREREGIKRLFKARLPLEGRG